MQQRSKIRKDLGTSFYEACPIPIPAPGVTVPEHLARAFFLHRQTRDKRPGLDPATMGEGLAQFVSSWHNTGSARREVLMESHGLTPEDSQLLAQDPVQHAAATDLVFFQNSLAAIASGLYYLTAELAPALVEGSTAHSQTLHIWAAMFELHGMMQHRVRQRVRHALTGAPLEGLPICSWPTPFRQAHLVPPSEPRVAPRAAAAQRGKRRGGGAPRAGQGFQQAAGYTAGSGTAQRGKPYSPRGFRGKGPRRDEPSQAPGGDTTAQ